MTTPAPSHQPDRGQPVHDPELPSRQADRECVTVYAGRLRLRHVVLLLGSLLAISVFVLLMVDRGPGMWVMSAIAASCWVYVILLLSLKKAWTLSSHGLEEATKWPLLPAFRKFVDWDSVEDASLVAGQGQLDTTVRLSCEDGSHFSVNLAMLASVYTVAEKKVPLSKEVREMLEGVFEEAVQHLPVDTAQKKAPK